MQKGIEACLCQVQFHSVEMNHMPLLFCIFVYYTLLPQYQLHYYSVFDSHLILYNVHLLLLYNVFERLWCLKSRLVVVCLL